MLALTCIEPLGPVLCSDVSAGPAAATCQVGISSKDAVNSMRSELLDLPDRPLEKRLMVERKEQQVSRNTRTFGGFMMRLIDASLLLK